MSTSTDRAVPFLKCQGLENHLIPMKKPPNEIHRVGEQLSGYGLQNMIVEGIDITFDGDNNLSVSLDSLKVGPLKWIPIQNIHWNFRDCRFTGLGTSGFSFSWAMGFRFDDCSFQFKTPPGPRNLAMTFADNSVVVFAHVDFGVSRVQIQVHDKDKALSIELYGNSGIDMLSIFAAAKRFRLNGTNHINHLAIGYEIVSLDVVEIGAFERIDPFFLYPDHHRQVFLELRRKASEREDNRQVNILDSYIDEIDYFLLKAQRVQGTWRKWLYLQKVAIYSLRKWSSNFHRSWFRPVVAMTIGFGALNMLPPLFIGSTTFVDDWFRLCANPLSRTSVHMEQILGESYTKASNLAKIGIDYVILIKIIWLAVWGIVLRKVLRFGQSS